MANSVIPSYPIFHDNSGKELNGGYIYVGVADKNPETDPVAVYLDANLTVQAHQPIRTIAGRPAHNGKPVNIYTAGDYSLTVRDSNKKIVYSTGNVGLQIGSAFFSGLQTYADNSEFITSDDTFDDGVIVEVLNPGYKYITVSSNGDRVNAGGQHFDVVGENNVFPALAWAPNADGSTDDASHINEMNVLGRVIDLGGKNYEYGGSFSTVALFKNGVVIDDNATFDFREVAKVSSVDQIANLNSEAFKQVDLLSDAMPGTFIWDSSDVSAEVAADTLKGIYVPPASDTSGASGAWVRNFDKSYGAQFSWFGGVADSSGVGTGTDQWPTLVSAFSTCVYLSVPLNIDKGQYRINPTEALNFPVEGGVLRGPKDVYARFNVDSAKTWEFGDDGSGPPDKFYGEISGIHIVGASICVARFGAGDLSTSILNSYKIDVRVNNNSTTPSNVALEFNFVLQSHIRFVSNGAQTGKPPSTGLGVACRMTQVQFCKIDAACGNGDVGMLLTGGFTQGNEFSGMLDIEEVSTGLRIESVNAKHNKFNSGTIVATTAVDASAGFANVMECGIIGIGYTGFSLFAPSGERFAFKNCNIPGFSAGSHTIGSLPSSATLVRNDSGRYLGIRTDGNITGLTITKADGNTYSLPSLGVGFPVDFKLSPYDGVTLTYTGTPSWVPYPLD